MNNSGKVDEQRATLATRGTRMPNLPGGTLCLNFANTVEPRGGPSPYIVPPDATRDRRDALADYTDLVAWAIVAGIVNMDEGENLLDAAAQQLAAVEQVFARAIALRETLYRLFWTIAQGGGAATDDLALLRTEHARTSRSAILRRQGDGYAWHWRYDAAELDGILWPIAQAAIELLIRGELERVKVCPGMGGGVQCAWLYYDESRNRSRQWCSMEDGCGQRAKAQRQNARRRISQARHL